MTVRKPLVAVLTAFAVLAMACGDDAAPVVPALPTFPAEQVPTKRFEFTPTAEPPATPTRPAVRDADELEADPFSFDIPTRERIEIQRAIEEWTVDIEKDPESVWAYVSRGQAYTRLGELDAAVEDLTKALKIDSLMQETYAARAAAYALRGDFGLAQQDLDTAATLGYPTGPLLEMFNRLLQQEQISEIPTQNKNRETELKEMLPDMDREIELNPTNALAYYKRGDIYFTLGHLERAIADYSEASRLDSRWGEPLAARAIAYAYLGMFTEAMRDSNEAAALDIPVERLMPVYQVIQYLP